MRGKAISFMMVLVMMFTMIPMLSYGEDETAPVITTISSAEIVGVAAPVKGETPSTAVIETEEYTASISWSGNPEIFAADTEYTATITIAPKEGFTLTGVSENFFTVAGAETSNDADSGIVTAVFPKTAAEEPVPETPADEGTSEPPEDGTVPETTGPALVPEIPVLPELMPMITTDTVISIPEIVGVTAPVTGATPVTVIADTTEYSATIAWSDDPVTFAADTVYTATITITPLTGYSLTGVSANFFTVEGAVTTNDAGSGVVTAVFPATASGPKLLEAYTNEDGDTITLVFDKAMADPSSDLANFTVKLNGSNFGIPVSTDLLIDSVGLNSNSSKEIDLNLHDPLKRGDIVTVDYTPGTVKAADETALDAVKDYSVTNTIPIEIESDLEGTWQVYDHVAYWGEDPFPSNHNDSRGQVYNRHIVTSGSSVYFYGYGVLPYKDFLYMPSDEAAAKSFYFELDLSGVKFHSMEGGGFLFNTVINVENDREYMDGYCALFTNNYGVYSVNLYQLDGVDVANFHDGNPSNLDGNPAGITKLGSYPLPDGDLHSIMLEASSDSVDLWDGNTKLIDNLTLPNDDYGYGVGVIGSYQSHYCNELSWFVFSNLSIKGVADLTAELDGTKANLTFTAPKGAESVTVEQSTDGVNFTPATLADPIDESSTTATVVGLQPCQTYYFRLVIAGGDYDGYSRVATAEYVAVAPELIDLYTNETGDKIILLFDKAMAEISDPTTAATSFSVIINGFNYDELVTLPAIVSSAKNSVTAEAIELVLEEPVQRGDIVTVGYTPGTIKAADNNELQAFADYLVTSNIPFKFNWGLDKLWDWYDHVGWSGEDPFLAGDDPRGHEFNRHIVSSGSAVVFYGYGNGTAPYKDFIYLPCDESLANAFSFDVDLSGLKSGNMEGGGFLFNTIIAYDEETSGNYLFGYYALFTNVEGTHSVSLYQLDGINTDALQNGAFRLSDTPEGITLLGSYELPEGDLHSIKLEPTLTSVSLWDGSKKIIDNLVLPEKYAYSIGVMGSSLANESNELSYFIFGNLKTIVNTPDVPSGGGGGGSGKVTPKNILRFQIADTNCYLTSGSAIEKKIRMDVAPILYEDRTLLPIRYVVEPLGGTAVWDQEEQKVTITLGKTTIEMWIGNNTAKVNGVEKMIDPLNPNVKPIIVEPGRTMLPLRFISEALGCTVDWYETTKKITVTDWD